MNGIEKKITDLVPPNSKILDLGCGDGELLRELMDKKQAQALGLEIDLNSIESCINKGVPVLQVDIDKGLPHFHDNQFDIAIVKQTIQTVRQPQLVFEEVLRVARQGIIIFPNFAHWRNRIRLLLAGRMPITTSLPYEWYDTPNIHLMSVVDFERFCRKKSAQIKSRHYFGNRWIDQICLQLGLNNLGSTAVLIQISRD